MCLEPSIYLPSQVLQLLPTLPAATAIMCLGPPMYVPSQHLQLLPTLPAATAITHKLLLLPALPAALTHAQPCLTDPTSHQVQAADPQLIMLLPTLPTATAPQSSGPGCRPTAHHATANPSCCYCPPIIRSRLPAHSSLCWTQCWAGG